MTTQERRHPRRDAQRFPAFCIAARADGDADETVREDPTAQEGPQLALDESRQARAVGDVRRARPVTKNPGIDSGSG